MLFGEPQTLIVVYKDELLVNQLKKLVESKDDNGAEVIGTRDDSVRIIAWSEKVWKDQKKAGNINNKVLFIGNVKGVDDLMPIVDVKYDAFGIKYGWAGNQAVLLCNNWKLKKAEDYNAFLKEFNKYPVSEALKSEDRKVEVEVVDAEPKKGFFNKLSNAIAKTAKNVGTSINDASSANSEKVIRQQYILGINKLYHDHLQEFMDK